ncbi:MAG: DUF2946 family protein [Burkholderiales bacterium]|nr:DUF2946 family protein [Burkholderiales bacterium]
MDEIVKAALAKWPAVPHCYGWLRLDARGNWRMRDARAQALNLPGDPIRNAALLAFIHRNYLVDARGCWYFQNGPQRVYADLEATPYIARSTPSGFVLHSGAPLPAPQSACFDPSGNLLLQADAILAQLDDRDLAACLNLLESGRQPVGDDALLAWLEAPLQPAPLFLRWPGAGDVRIPVRRMTSDALMQEYGYSREPRA